MQNLLLEFAMRSLLIAAAVGIALLVLRVTSAAVRHAAWLLVVIWMLVLPASIAWGLKAHLRILPVVRPATVTLLSASAAPVPQIDGVPISEKRRSPAWEWQELFFAGWVLGVLILMARLAIGAVRANLLIRTIHWQDGHRMSPKCAAPVTVGWFRPVVILPESWRTWSESQLAVVLAHEKEHVRRRDPLMQFLALFNRALFWFHPLAWWLERRLSALAEEACDAAVLSRGHDPYEYSRYLLEMARAVERAGKRVDVLGMAMPGSFLPQRIRQILSANPVRPVTRARALCATGVCLFLSSVFAAGTLDRARPQFRAAVPLLVQIQPQNVPAAAPATQTRPTPAPQPKSVRLLIFYFDMAAMNAAEQTRAASAAQNFVSTRMQAGDRAAIMVYRANEFRVMQDFTGDHETLLNTIHQLPGVDSGAASPDEQARELERVLHVLEPIQEKKLMIYFSSGARRTGAATKSLIDAAIRANVAFLPIDVRSTLPQEEPPQEPIPAAAFDAASVKKVVAPADGRNAQRGLSSPDPATVVGHNATLGQAIRYAYNVQSFQVVGPEWIEYDIYDIQARASQPATPDQLRQMTQALLAERFRLALHRETRNLPVYEMTIAKGGFKMPEVKEGEQPTNQRPALGFSMLGTVNVFAGSIAKFSRLQWPIIDKTGLTARYRFEMVLNREEDLVPAIQEQLGLKLTPKTDPIEVLVIDHVEKVPTDN